MPAYVNGMGRGTIPRDSPHLFSRTRREAMEACDVVVLAGAVLDFRLAFGASIPKQAKIIQLEMDSAMIGHNRPADVGLVGNLACTFELMVRVMEEEQVRLGFWRVQRRTAGERAGRGGEQAGRMGSDDVPIDAMRLCREIADFVDDDMIVIGTGRHRGPGGKVVPIPKNGLWMDPGPLGTLGVGMPFAIAASTGPHGQTRVDHLL